MRFLQSSEVQVKSLCKIDGCHPQEATELPPWLVLGKSTLFFWYLAMLPWLSDSPARRAYLVVSRRNVEGNIVKLRNTFVSVHFLLLFKIPEIG